MKTITANIPAKTVKKGTFCKTFPARTVTFAQDAEGRWTDGYGDFRSEASVIDECKQSDNWAAIKAEHFPMVGFHS